MSSAPSISAMIASPGMPRVRVGMKADCAAALLALSGAEIPAMFPVPNVSGAREVRFSTA